MKSKELKSKSKKELEAILKESREKLGRLKFDLAAKKLKNVYQIKAAKKDIARILTLLNQK